MPATTMRVRRSPSPVRVSTPVRVVAAGSLGVELVPQRLLWWCPWLCCFPNLNGDVEISACRSTRAPRPPR